MSFQVNGSIRGPYNASTTTAAAGRWGPNDVSARMARQNLFVDTWPKVKDPSFSSVSLLCHCQRMVDRTGSADLPVIQCATSAQNQPAMQSTAGGNVLFGLSNEQVYWGDTAYNNGTGGNGGQEGLVCPQASAEFTFGVADLTFDFLFYQSTSGNTEVLIDGRATAGSPQVVPLMYVSAANKLMYHVNGADVITGATSVSTSAWHWAQLSRVSGSTILYLDGAQEGSTYVDANNYVSIPNLYLCASFVAGPTRGSGLKGFVQEIRITKGVGRYTGSTSTVPTIPFPDY